MSESDDEAGFASADEGDGDAMKTPSNTPSNQGEGEGKTMTTPSNTRSDRPDTTDVGMVRITVEGATSTDTHTETEGAPAAEPVEKRETTPTRKAKRLSQELPKSQDTESAGTETGDNESESSQSKVEIDRTEEDNQSVLNKLSGAAKQGAGWGWGGLSSVGSWGTTVLSKGTSALNTGLSTATSSVQHFADSVGEGLHVVFDPIEAAMDISNPEELTDSQIERKPAKPPPSPPETPDASPTVTEQPHGGSEALPGDTISGDADDTETSAAIDDNLANDTAWFGGWGGVSLITTAMKKTMKDTTEVFKEQGMTLVTGSKNLAHGTLDVLETIGKKTYDVLAEGDHGLKETIKKTKEKTNLSQMLREAKERAERDAKEEEEFTETRKAHFGAQFDDFQGLVQLEALEMLSNQCEGRVQGMLSGLKGAPLETVKGDLVAIKHAFILEEMEEEEDEDKDHEFDRLLSNYIGQVGLNATPERLIQVQEKCRKYLMDLQQDLDDDQERLPKGVHESAIQSLAEFTARCIEHYHRVGQLILLDKSVPISSYKTKAVNLASATRVLCAEVGIFSVKFTQCLGTLAHKSEDSSSINPMITNVYLEASNSSTYIQDAFLLLLPVVQQGALEAHQRAALLDEIS